MRCFENTSDWLWKRDKPLGIFQLQGTVDKNMQSNYCETNDVHRISGVLNYLKVLNENFETTSIIHTITYITHTFSQFFQPPNSQKSINNKAVASIHCLASSVSSFSRLGEVAGLHHRWEVTNKPRMVVTKMGRKKRGHDLKNLGVMYFTYNW